jgi:creatinine amidohydrolase
MEEMTWPQVKEAIEQGYWRILVALGSIEQHGPHLPLVTDTLIGDALAVRVAEKLGQTLVAPTIRPGCSEHHMNFPGTLSISSELLAALTRAYCHALARHGFQAILLLPTHGGNFPTVARLLSELAQEIPAKVVGYADLIEFTKVQDAIMARYGVSSADSGAHAGCAETSLVLAERANLVRMDHAQTGFVGDFLAEAQRIKPSDAGLDMRMENFSPIGVLGDPRGAGADMGRALLEGLAEHLATFYRAALL